MTITDTNLCNKTKLRCRLSNGTFKNPLYLMIKRVFKLADSLLAKIIVLSQFHDCHPKINRRYSKIYLTHLHKGFCSYCRISFTFIAIAFSVIVTDRSLLALLFVAFYFI